MWSAYNYWCQLYYDRNCDPATHWVKVGQHIRSPEIFHDIIVGSINGSNPNSPLQEKHVCEDGDNFYQSITNELWANIPVEDTLIIPSELLEYSPSEAWLDIAAAIGWRSSHPRMHKFEDVRYNTQLQDDTKGKLVKASLFKPGLYAASGNQPVLNSTRRIMDQCWEADCIWTSVVTNFSYPACSANTSEYLKRHDIINRAHTLNLTTNTIKYLVTRSLSRSNSMYGFLQRMLTKSLSSTIRSSPVALRLTRSKPK